MAQNIIFILTEGDHDAAFIYRILKTKGFSSHHCPIKDFLYPLNSLFCNGISSVQIEELQIDSARSRFMPYKVMSRDNNMVSIYTIGGDRQEERRIMFIDAINALNSPNPDEIQVVKDTTISILFFFDADDKGVDHRLEQIKSELRSCSFNQGSVRDIDSVNNKAIIQIEDINFGAFVFTEQGKDTGLLEDILIPLMKQGNEDIFGHAESFLSIHETTVLFRGKVTYVDAQKKRINGAKYDHNKSLVGTIGQLQKSGKSNTVCISDSDYLCDDKINDSKVCTEIFSLIEQVIV
jgi:hypothetical protein